MTGMKRELGFISIFCFILAAGASQSHGETAIATDKNNYSVGDTVRIEGTEWLPGETVTLYIFADTVTTARTTLSAIADENGRFVSSEFIIGSDDVDKSFFIEAEGQTSGSIAAANFIDGYYLKGMNVSGQTPKLAQPGNSATFTVTVYFRDELRDYCHKHCWLCPWHCHLEKICYPTGFGPSITTPLPPGTAYSFSDQGYDPQSCSRSLLLTITTAPNTPIGEYPFTVEATAGSYDVVHDHAVLYVYYSDITPPVANASPLPSIIGQCTAEITSPPTATDYIDGTVIGTTTNPLTYSNQGTYTVHWTYTDAAGNQSSQPQVVIVQDTTPPTFGWVWDITKAVDPGKCTAAVEFSVPVFDNCGIATVAYWPPSGTHFPVGATTVTCTAQDIGGNTSSRQFKVTVVDNIPPTITCPQDIELMSDPNALGAIVHFSLSATDNCSGVEVSSDPASGSFFPAGTTAVQCLAVDAKGNSSTCEFTVTILCPGATLPGDNVVVVPEDTLTGESPVTFTFAEVTEPGLTSLEITEVGQPPPFGFKLGSPPTYLELSTTAAFTGPVLICVDYSTISFGNEASLRLYHREDGVWVDRTASLDPDADIICAEVASFSTFALFEQVPPAAIAGIVTADCPAENTPLMGATVDAFNMETGDLVATGVTDINGSFVLDSLHAGYYNATIITPLGYTVAAEEIPVTIEGIDVTVNFNLVCRQIAAEPRSSGFWKHQFGVATGGAGHAQIDAGTLCGYLDLIEMHFNSNAINQIALYQPPPTGSCEDMLLQAKMLLNLKGDVETINRARQQLMALLLNVSAEKLSLWEVISDDGATVSQAITYCDRLIDDPAGNHENAHTIADMINNAAMVPAKMIPLDIEQIAYGSEYSKNDHPQAFALGQNHPNPFNPTTRIPISIPQGTAWTLGVFDILGRLVRQFSGITSGPEFVEVQWDGKNSRGESVSSGVYIYRLEAGRFAAVKKMVLLR